MITEYQFHAFMQYGMFGAQWRWFHLIRPQLLLSNIKIPLEPTDILKHRFATGGTGKFAGQNFYIRRL